jgi:hypothetical protein
VPIFGFQHCRALAATAAAFLTPDFFSFLPARRLRAQNALLNSVAQFSPGQEPVQGALPRLLALDLNSGGQMQ